MSKCKIVLEPVQTAERLYVNGETLIADETTIASLVSAGVAVRIEEEEIETPKTKVVSAEILQPTSRRRRQTEEIEEVI